MIYTFYSYKGGVGRSMALANVAEWFYQQGLRVVIVDWDLEAPGLENFFFDEQEELDLVRSQLGLVDMLMAYKRIFPRLTLTPAAGGKEGGKEDQGGQGSTGAMEIFDQHLQPVSDLLYPIHAPETGSDGKGGALWLLTAGWRSGDRFPVYAQTVQSFGWADFYASYQGELYFDWMRKQLVAEDLADVVLIDSRTGVTEMGGVCTRQMADVVVSFCVPNMQNLAGVATMVRSFGREELKAKRDRELEVVVVPTRIDVNELDARNHFEKQFHKTMDGFIPGAFKTVNSNFWDLYIQYIPNYAYDEKLAINRSDGAKELKDAYARLGAHLTLLAQGQSGLRIRRALGEPLKEIFGNRLPSGFISYEGDEGEAQARDLHERLKEHGIRLWANLAEMKGKFEVWRQVAGILDQSRFLVLVVTPDALQSPMVQKQLRYARQQGVNIYLVKKDSSELKPGETGVPRWIPEANIFDLHQESEWERFIRALQSSAPAARVPLMAPDLPERYVPRPSISAQLKNSLLVERKNQGGVNAALWGPGGSGKSAEAIAFCQDEQVISYFDGILWATLGVNPNILAELTKLYTALTGELPHFDNEDQAASRFYEKLAERNCLIVLNDVWSAKHLEPFTLRGHNCSRLITTRDLNIAFGIDAKLIEVGQMTPQEAEELTSARLPLDPELRGFIGELAGRLDNWPLALTLANTELRKRTQKNVAVGSELQDLRRDIEKLGALAFDAPGGTDGKQLISQTIASSLDALPQEDRERYIQLAYFQENREIKVEEISELWMEDEFEAGKRIQRLADVSLLRYDPQQKKVKLQGVIRDYILNQLSGKDGLSENIEAAFSHFSPQEQEAARRIFTRLVRLALPEEQGEDTRLRCKLSDFDADVQPTIKALIEAKLVSVEQDKATSESMIQVANEAFIKGWKRLREWIEQDRGFLLWRQQLKAKIAEWESTNHDRGALVSGAPLVAATHWLNTRGADLNDTEKLYLTESIKESERLLRTRQKSRILVAAMILAALFLAAYFIQRANRQAAKAEEERVQAELENAKTIKATAYNNAGKNQAARADFDSAIDSYTLAIETKPNYAEAYFNRAEVYVQQQKLDAAVADYTLAIKIKPDYAEAYFSRGNVYSLEDYNKEVDHDEQAIADYTSAIQIKPNYADAYLNRGYTYENQKRYDQALADYNHAIEATPESKPNAVAYLRRGVTYAQLNQPDRAIPDLQKAIETTITPWIRLEASQNLIKLGYTKPRQQDSTAAAPKIFIQYNNANDLPTLKSIQADLVGAGFNVQGIELRDERAYGDVRYFNPEDKQNAENIRRVVFSRLDKQGYNMNIQLRYLGDVYVSVPRGNIEIWLPQLLKRDASLPQDRGASRKK